MEKATIFNIMRYCIHDGPGIRTTIFFKGCHLSCKWCHNPESLEQKPLKIFHPEKCIKCGHCDNCPTGARETIGYEITIPKLMEEIRKDLPFYEQSGGGATFSGGEPLNQAEFLLKILAQCREEYINTAVDSSGFCSTAALLEAAGYADYFLYDIKFFNSDKHEKYCGAPNGIILNNLERLAETKAKILVRIPVIPTINDDMEEMKSIFNFLCGINNIEAVHFLPYHNMHAGKYAKIGKQYELLEISGNESPNMERIVNLFGGKFRTKIGG